MCQVLTIKLLLTAFMAEALQMRNRLGERKALLKATDGICPFTYLVRSSLVHRPPLHSMPGPRPSLSRAAMTDLSSWSVVLGSLQREGLSPGAEEIGVTSLQLPRAYNHYSQGSDLALLQLAQPTAHTPLCLPRPAHRFPFGTSCWATGWDQDISDGKCCPRRKPRGSPLAHSRSLSWQRSLLLVFRAPQSPDSSPKPVFFQLPGSYGICACV